MISLDQLKEAKQQFLDDYANRIRGETGYNLSAGIGASSKSSKNWDAIAARIITTESEIPETVREQIEGILPKMYSYNGQPIPVETAYVTNLRA